MRELTVHSPKKERAKAGMAIVHIEAVCLSLFLLLLLGNLTLICRARLLGEKVPMLFGIAPLIVQSDSMYPEICSGDLLFIKAAGIDDVREGDVISYVDPRWNGSGVVTHRVDAISVSDGVRTLTTKGDANDSADPWPVEADQLVGILVFRLKGLGRAAMVLQTAPAAIAVTAASFLLVLWAVFARGHGRRPLKRTQIKKRRTQHDKKETI